MTIIMVLILNVVAIITIIMVIVVIMVCMGPAAEGYKDHNRIEHSIKVFIQAGTVAHIE